MRRRTLRSVPTVLLSVGLLASCAGDAGGPSEDRGATTSTAPPGSPAPPDVATAEEAPPRAGRALVTVPSVRPLVPATTTTTDPAATPIGELEVGDCVDLPGLGLPETVEVVNALRRDCADPHGAEIHAVIALDEDPTAPYPGDEAVTTTADETCLSSFAAYVGVEYVHSSLEILHLRPDEAAWTRGERVVHCGVYDPAGEPLVGTVQGSGR